MQGKGKIECERPKQALKRRLMALLWGKTERCGTSPATGFNPFQSVYLLQGFATLTSPFTTLTYSYLNSSPFPLMGSLLCTINTAKMRKLSLMQDGTEWNLAGS